MNQAAKSEPPTNEPFGPKINVKKRGNLHRLIAFIGSKTKGENLTHEDVLAALDAGDLDHFQSWTEGDDAEPDPLADAEEGGAVVMPQEVRIALRNPQPSAGK